ncbi:hypothetical protein GX50_07585 [[Emmonsia] crescens]|uniref:Uncharacterized protein n=1 Tax=[Emmonsia] crescens TaxID=73230 RepID=A0A2B7YZW9_9EURO|nr:hypothetical protein GX50_07585 [Emmonsia crescens]
MESHVTVSISNQDQECFTNAQQASTAVQVASKNLLYGGRDSGKSGEEDVHNGDLGWDSVDWPRTSAVECIHSRLGGFLNSSIMYDGFGELVFFNWDEELCFQSSNFASRSLPQDLAGILASLYAVAPRIRPPSRVEPSPRISRRRICTDLEHARRIAPYAANTLVDLVLLPSFRVLEALLRDLDARDALSVNGRSVLFGGLIGRQLRKTRTRCEVCLKP